MPGGTNGVQTEYKRGTNGVQKEYKRIQTEYKRLQTEYKNITDTTSLVQQIRTELIWTIAIATNGGMPRIYFFIKIDRIIEGAYKHGTETISWSLRRGGFQPWPPCFPASVKASASAVEDRWLQELRKVARYNTSAGLPWHGMVLPDPLAQTAGAFCAFERQQGGNKNVMLTKN